MKPFLLVLLFAGIGAAGVSLAQNHIDISNNNGHTSITIRCNQDSSHCTQRLRKTMRPPLPPLPPSPPSPPLPPAPPPPPLEMSELSLLAELAELADLADLPAPPPPPEPFIPKQVHRACQGKQDGQAAHWHIGRHAYYSGTCRQHQGAMQLDVSHIDINNFSSQKNTFLAIPN